MESKTTFPTSLADGPAGDVLIARHRERDSHFPQIPDWSEGLLFYFNVSLMSGPRAKQDWNGEPPQLDSIHSYGPSLRQLWSQARADDGNEEAAWAAIVNWILYRPLSWDYDDARQAELSQHLNTSVIEWTSTSDLNLPWSADQHWHIRINDFPDAYMYSLLVGEDVIGDFHDWPAAWTRAEGPGSVDPKPKPQLTVFAAPQGIAPEHLLPRYLAGECDAVWSDLIQLGPAIRQKPYFEPAQAVCREMARRSRQNLLTLFGRLHELEFEFWSIQPPKLIRLATQEAKEPWTQSAVWKLPKKDTAAKLARLEKKGIILPLAVRVWVEEIGELSFLGSHPSLCRFYAESQPLQPIYADPFMVSPILPMLGRSLDDMEGNTESVLISFDDVLKAEIASDPGSDKEYSIEYPNAFVDSKMNGLWYDATFVGYVRKSFEWGGFPGWERYSQRPEKELDFLRQGLLPI
jgi:hypothetical protein